MAQYWLGDPHFGHPKVSEIRGFASTDDHDAVLMEQLSVLREEDHIFFLGDISSGRREHEERALTLISTLPGTKHLIAGNHDAVSGIHRNGWKHVPRWLEIFDSVRDFGQVALNKNRVLMSHYPYAALGDGDGRESNPRYLAFRLPDVGMPLIHAHTHQDHPFSKMRDETVTKIEFRGYDLNSMCVSWDARRGLTTENDLNEWLKAREDVQKQREQDRIRKYWGAFPKPEPKVA